MTLIAYDSQLNRNRTNTTSERCGNGKLLHHHAKVTTVLSLCIRVSAAERVQPLLLLLLLLKHELVVRRLLGIADAALLQQL